nr:uncharacterized protein LOC128781338 isoform X1 [Desmodus rotundus]
MVPEKSPPSGLHVEKLGVRADGGGDHQVHCRQLPAKMEGDCASDSAEILAKCCPGPAAGEAGSGVSRVPPPSPLRVCRLTVRRWRRPGLGLGLRGAAAAQEARAPAWPSARARRGRTFLKAALRGFIL